MRRLLRRLRRRPDAWAVPGMTFPCSLRCGYLFERRGDVWWANTNPEDFPNRWGTVGDWADLRQEFADCAAYLGHAYGGR